MLLLTSAFLLENSRLLVPEKKTVVCTEGLWASDNATFSLETTPATVTTQKCNSTRSNDDKQCNISRAIHVAN